MNDPRAMNEPHAGTERLSHDERRRYARHLVLPHVGEEGQLRLGRARVLVVGAGGLGSPAALYLAAAGVGTLGLVEFDRVELSNLQRQILHGTGDTGRPKIESAADTLREVNPLVRIEPYPVRLSSTNALDILARYDVVVDGSDNFPTRYLVNDACVMLGIPLVYGSILRWEGQVSLFGAPGGPCYRCIFRDPPPPELVATCAEAGVFGALPGVIGSVQAMEAIKMILGAGESLSGRLQLFDALAGRWREVTVPRDPACPVCGDDPTVTELVDYEVFCGLRPEDAVLDAAPRFSLSPVELRAALSADDPPLLVDVREGWEWEVGNLSSHGAVHIPLAELPGQVASLPRDRSLVFLCSVGARSAGAATLARERGYGDAANLKGGLVEWVREVDPDLVIA